MHQVTAKKKAREGAEGRSMNLADLERVVVRDRRTESKKVINKK